MQNKRWHFSLEVKLAEIPVFVNTACWQGRGKAGVCTTRWMEDKLLGPLGRAVWSHVSGFLNAHDLAPRNSICAGQSHYLRRPRPRDGAWVRCKICKYKCKYKTWLMPPSRETSQWILFFFFVSLQKNSVIMTMADGRKTGGRPLGKRS